MLPDKLTKALQPLENKQCTDDVSTIVSDMMSLKKADLVTICIHLKLPKSGIKNDLIRRILNSYDIDTRVNTSSTKTDIKPKPNRKGTVHKTIIREVLARIKKPVILLHRNLYGNYEHCETSFIFDSQQKVIGKQKGCEAIPLTVEDIILCKEYKFKYDIPNLL